MTILILGFLTVLIPISLVLWFVFSNNRDRLEWVTKLILIGNVTFLFFQIGPWAITSYYLRYVVVILFVLGIVYSYVRNWCSLCATNFQFRHLLVKASVVTTVAGLNIVSIIGKSPPDNSVGLRFPLKGESYYLLQGGTTWITNLFHSLIPTGKYAVDIVQINDFGNRAASLFPPLQLTQYHIYEANLYSPCSGTVKEAIDSLPDNVPPTIDWEHREGNHVVIVCNGVEVTLLHMKKGSLKVFNGDSVAIGQPIGMVGNSGYSDEPHLHIQANTMDGGSVPIMFDGKFLSVNDVYSN